MRVGTDIVEIERINQAVLRQPNFPNRILSADELALYDKMNQSRSAEFLAGRFSVKEAYVKALGRGIGRIQFTDISVGYDQWGAPQVVAGPIVQGIHLSISHSQSYATATVVVDLAEEQVQYLIEQFIEMKNNETNHNN